MKLRSTLLLSAALVLGARSYGQMHVTTTDTIKYVLLEEGTGSWCGYCPDGAEDIERNITPNYPHCIVASFHNGDPMALANDAFNTDYVGAVGWPGATIDRTMLAGQSTVAVGRAWDSYVGTALTGGLPNFRVDMRSTFDTGSRLLTVLVTGTALNNMTGDFNLNAYVTEDSISSATGTYMQNNYARPACGSSCNAYTYFCGPQGDTSWFWMLGDPIVPASKYWHMNVVRRIISTDSSIYGDAAFSNPSAGTTVSMLYTYTIPRAYVAKNMKIIGLVQDATSAGGSGPIENSIFSKIRLLPLSSVGVAPSPTMMDVEVYPNPAKTAITVKGMLDNPADTRIVIYNSIGQVMVDNAYKAGSNVFAANIGLNGMANGLYFMNIINNGQSVTKQFVINK